MKESFRGPYIGFSLAIAATYFVLNVYFSGFYKTLLYLPVYADTVNWASLLLGTSLSAAIALLVGLNSVLAYRHFRLGKNAVKGGAAAGLGSVGGMAAGVCTACGGGLAMSALSAAGLSVSLASLPLKGLEVQLLTLGVLAGGFYMASKRQCESLSQAA